MSKHTHPGHHDISDMGIYAGATVHKFLLCEGEDMGARIFRSGLTDDEAQDMAQKMLAQPYTLVTVSRVEVPEDYPISRAQYTAVWSGSR